MTFAGMAGKVRPYGCGLGGEGELAQAAHARASHTESEAMCACKRVHVTLGKSWHGRGLFLFLLSRNVPGLRC